MTTPDRPYIDIAEDAAKQSWKEALHQTAAEHEACKRMELQPITVSQALRNYGGRHTVSGTIISRTEVYNLITGSKALCANCGNIQERAYPKPEPRIDEARIRCHQCQNLLHSVEHDYVSAVTVWVQDKEPHGELEKLPVVLFGKDNENIGTGEDISVTGIIHIVKFGRNGRLAPILHAEQIEYQNREELILTSRDINAIRQFSLYPDCACGQWSLVDRLVSMVGLPIVSHSAPKLGLLLAAVNSEDVRGRIHVLFVGDPGEAKSSLAREGRKMVPNSKYVTAQYATGKSMTAIIDRENDMYTLKYGPVALAKKTLCVINELGKLTYEDQGFLFDVMEEGHFNLNKYGFDKPIEAPTTIIATTNQIDVAWHEADKISNSEVPILKPLRDRFDLLFGFRSDNSAAANRRFAYEKAKKEAKRMQYNYNYIRKYVQYCKRLNPRLTEEAESMLNEYWIQIATDEEFTSKRILRALFKLAKAFARLYLKDLIDIPSAKAAIGFYNQVIYQYGRRIIAPLDPRTLAVQETRKFIRKASAPVAFEFALRCITNENQQLQAYFGTASFRPDSNWKVRAVYDIIKQSPGEGLHIVSTKPLVFASDSSEASATRNPTDGSDVNDGSDANPNLQN